MVKNSHIFLEKELMQLEAHLPVMESCNTKVSKASVAWHIDHSLKTIIVISDALMNSEPDAYKTNFSFSRIYCFLFGYIPRGVGKSPKLVLPPDTISKEDIFTQLQTARVKLLETIPLSENANLIHPYFKQLNKKQSLRFIQLHTQHHLKIIRDILKES